MCLLRYLHRIWCILEPLSCTIKWTYSEQEQNIILSIIWQQTDRNVCIHNAKPFEDETYGKEHCENQNEQQVLGSNQNDRPVNLSAQVQDVNKTCGLVYAFHLFGFTFHTAFWVVNKHNGTGETKSWQNDKEAAHSDSNFILRASVGGKFADWELYTSKAISVFVRTRMQTCGMQTNNCREKQRLLSIGRDAEEILAHVYFSPLSVDSRPIGRRTRSQPTVDRLSADCRPVRFRQQSFSTISRMKQVLAFVVELTQTPDSSRDSGQNLCLNASLKSTRATKMRRNWCEFCQSTLQATPNLHVIISKVISCWTQTDLSLMQKAL